jgi:hypothetical protein
MTVERTIKNPVQTALTTIACLFLALSFAQPAAAAVLVPTGATWKYLDNGSDQGSAWRNPAFNDALWPANAAQFGYGDGGEATVVSYGPIATNKYITTYFRHAFDVADPSSYAGVTISLLRDDGAVVYLNGREVFRSNMPGGAIAYRTPASANIGGADESTFYPTAISATNLASGRNLLAVEIHQASTNSSDVSFDLELVGNTRPVIISLLCPANGAGAVASTAQLGIDVRDVTTTNVVTIFGRPAGPPPGPDFTIIALPDTQYYVANANGGRPEMFVAQTDWILANRAAKNIAFVTLLGDCVEHGDNGGDPVEWLHATNAMYRLEDPRTTLLTEGIPYGVAVGNHDQTVAGSPDSATSFYNQFFGEAHFAGHDYYGGHYGTNNDNHFQLFSASGLDFIIVHIEFDPAQDTNVLNWADALLKQYSDRRAIIVSHFILAIGGSFGAQGQKLYDGLKANPNLFLMLCGHEPGENRRSDTFNGNVVHTVLADFQGRTNGGSGFLRTLEFSPSNNVIRVKTWSPTFNAFEQDANSEFTLDYDMSRGGPLARVGTFTDVCTATNLATAWSGLAANTTYEWFAEVTDGDAITRSACWKFTTGRDATPLAAAPFRLNLTRDVAGNMVLSWPTTVGAVYEVVYRENLVEGGWTSLSGELSAGASTLAWTTPIDASSPPRFFAVRQLR